VNNPSVFSSFKASWFSPGTSFRKLPSGYLSYWADLLETKISYAICNWTSKTATHRASAFFCLDSPGWLFMALNVFPKRVPSNALAHAGCLWSGCNG